MKTLLFSVAFILFACAFTGCNKELGQEGSVPSANAGSVQVKFKTTASPVLKDGEDENDPEPMFDITGVVTQNSNPVSAEVELVSMPQSTLIDSTNTDSNGGFEFYQVPSGSYNVVVYVDGNIAETIEVNL